VHFKVIHMTPDQYLNGILARESVDSSPTSPVRSVQQTLAPILQKWGGTALRSVSPSGSFAKGTANSSGTDIDLFISLHGSTPSTLKEIYDTLFNAVKQAGYSPTRQDVSINIRVGSYDVDLVPAKRQDTQSEDHSLYRRKANTWTKTNVQKHIAHVRGRGRLSESRILKLWRRQKGLDFPSFYLELTTIDALTGTGLSTLAERVMQTFLYLRDSFPNARVIDPANTNNIISDDLTAAEKQAIKSAAAAAITAKTGGEIVK
jgi:hypothetical protein